MVHWEYLFLLGGGFAGGVINSVAGGGALLIYPFLLSLGIAPITSNATTTLTVWPGALSSAYGYRKHILKLPKYFYFLLLPSLIGGLIGAILLKQTSNHDFQFIVPWFIVAGVSLLLIQPKIHRWLYEKNKTRDLKKRNKLTLLVISVALFVVAIYGGYFGAGFGIIMLGFLGLTELTDLQQMNGLKNLCAVAINLIASLYFIAYRLIDWHFIPLLIIGSVAGGLVGSTYSSKLPSNLIRYLVIAIGIVVVVVLFKQL